LLGAASRRLLTRTASRRARPAAGPGRSRFAAREPSGSGRGVPRPRMSVAATWPWGLTPREARCLTPL